MQIVTNNPKVYEKFSHLPLTYIEGSYGDVLKQTKELVITKKYPLLMHPLSGSIKPNETYYKTIALDDNSQDSIDLNSLELMEQAEHVYEKFIASRPTPNWTAKVLNDFATVDLDIFTQTLSRMQPTLLTND